MGEHATRLFRMAVYQSGDMRALAPGKTTCSPFLEDRNTTFVDIGANIGWHSSVMSKTFRVVAFEPFEANRALIKPTTCESNRHMDLRPYALANETSTCTLHQIPSVNYGDTRDLHVHRAN